MLAAGSRQDAYGRSRTRAFRESFLASYAIRIGERLSPAAQHAPQEAAASRAPQPGSLPVPLEGVGGTGSAGAALVPFLGARRQVVDDVVDEMFSDKLRWGRSAQAAAITAPLV